MKNGSELKVGDTIRVGASRTATITGFRPLTSATAAMLPEGGRFADFAQHGAMTIPDDSGFEVVS